MSDYNLEKAYGGTLRVSNQKTLFKRMENGKFAEDKQCGFLFKKACKRFIKDGCNCSKCRKSKIMKIAFFSDSHGYLPEVIECDILFISGDICPANDHSAEYQINWINNNFKNWCDKIACKKIIMTPGNHDLCFENNLEQLIFSDKVKVLINELYIYENLRIYGTPVCKQFCDWAFMKPYNELAEVYENIPEKLDFLLTHDAPLIGNHGTINEGPYRGNEAGNQILAEYIRKRKPKFVIHGHIHSGNFYSSNGETTIFNGSIKNEDYLVTNGVKYIEYSNNMVTFLNDGVQEFKNAHQVDEAILKIIDKYYYLEESRWQLAGFPEDHVFHSLNILKTLYENGGASEL